jgi:predicted CXXCH cytochrome family protein
VSSGNLSGVFQAGQGPFLSLVPFATNSGDYTVLGGLAANNGSQLGGPQASDQVMCLSCHRAHASGFPEAIRWQMEGEFITYVNGFPSGPAIWPGTDNGCASGGSCAQFSRGRTGVEQAAGYYDRPVTVFGPYQRVLCNKCHARD